MKKPPTPIIFGALLILMLSYIWWWANQNNEVPLTNIQTVSPIKATPLAKNDLTQEMPDAKPTLTNMTDKQRQFSQQVQELIAATTECRKDIEALFPVEGLEGTSKTYKNISQFQDAIKKFYTVVSKKVEKSNQLINFMETLGEGDIQPDQLFSQLSAIEDCGDFEEEAVLDQAMSTALDLKWSIDQKRELSATILQLFKNQLQLPLGLHQISSKIEVLHSLVDDGFLPSRLSTELTTLDQAMDAAEAEFRQALPQEFSETKYPTVRNVVEIKSKEIEVSNNLKTTLSDVITSAESSIN